MVFEISKFDNFVTVNDFVAILRGQKLALVKFKGE